MANYNVALTFEFMDANGQRCITKFPLNVADTTTLATLKTDLDDLAAIIGHPGGANGLSNAKIVQRSIGVVVDHAHINSGTNDPVDGVAYPGVQQKALMRFANAPGSRMLLSLPAPVDDNVFGEPPGDDLVDPSIDLPTAGVTGLKTLIAWVQGHCKDGAGVLYNEFTGGTLKGGKRPRRRATTWQIPAP